LIVRSSNPVLTRLTPETQRGYPAPSPGYPQQQYQSPVVTSATDRMTLDDVVVRTVGLLAVTGLSGAVAWMVLPDNLRPVALFGGMVIGLILGLVISLARITNPALILAYAVAEGAFLGAISEYYNDQWNGIVVQAVVGTFGIFLLMTALYKFRVIRNSPRFSRTLTSIVIGIMAIYLVSWILSFFNVQVGLFARNADGSGTWLSIGFSLFVVIIASLTFILDFDLIEQSVAQGAPKKVAWTCAFGVLVGLIWVYLEVLRLLSYLRGRD